MLPTLTLALTLLLPASPVEDLRTYLAKPAAERKPLAEQPFFQTPLSKEDANTAANLLYEDSLARLREERRDEWTKKSITAAGQTMKFEFKVFGATPKPPRGRALFISMHGGGGAPHEVNESQWKNQIGLYQPSEGVYLAPRAPTDTWNLWHEPHIDALFDRLIEDAVALEGVDPDHVYLMGYSAGGDGVYQLAPRMADRFAAASMMAGHPNDASPLGLRNLPFAIHVGALDDGYNRNKVAGEWGKKLDDLKAADPDPQHAYIHLVKLHEGRAHWMNKEDAEALPWMYNFARNPFPTRVVWKQAGTTHTRFYWLSVKPEDAKPGAEIVASIKDNLITIEASKDVPAVTILLHDRLLNLDQPINIKAGRANRLVLIKSPPEPRTIANLSTSLAERHADKTLYSARLTITLPDPPPEPIPMPTGHVTPK